MAKKDQIIAVVLSVLLVIGTVAFATGASINSEADNESSINDNATYSSMNDNATPESSIYPYPYPPYAQPDIELQTSYISDTLYAGTTYTYIVQVKNIGDKNITIEPRFNMGYPIIYPMASTVKEVDGANVSNVTENVTLTPEPAPVEMPVAVPMMDATSSVSPKMIAGSSGYGQAFDNDAIDISAPSIIKAGEIVNMTIVVTVPDNATGNYYTSIDMNVNNVENDPSNSQLSLSFNVLKPVTSPFIKNFSLKKDSVVTVELSADTYSSDMGTRVSPKVESPSFDITFVAGDTMTNLTLLETTETGNVGVGYGMQYPAWSSDNTQEYQNYGSHYVYTYRSWGSADDYELRITPKNTNNFGYTITIGDIPVR